MLGVMRWMESALTWFPALREALGSLQDPHSYIVLAFSRSKISWAPTQSLRDTYKYSNPVSGRSS